MDSMFYNQGTQLNSRNLNGAVADAVNVAGKAISKTTAFIKKLASLISTERSVFFHRDKIAQYVTQVLGNRDAAYSQLYTGFKLAHADVKNVATSSYYEGVFQRLNEAAINYIVKHAGDSSKIFGQNVDPQATLDRYTKSLEAGNSLGDSFWIAFTGRKSPYDIKTGRALPTSSPTPTTSNPIQQIAQGYNVIKDAQGKIIEIRDAITGRVVAPGTTEYNAAASQNTQSQAGGKGLVLLGVAGLLAAAVYFGGKSKSAQKNKAG